MCHTYGRVGYYRAKKGTPLDNKATSMHVTKGDHTVEKEL